MDELKDILKKVQSNKRPWRDAGESEMPDAILILRAYDGSLDAAQSLHNHWLKDWRVTHAWGWDEGWTWCLTKASVKYTYAEGRGLAKASRAWLSAIISARIKDRDLALADLMDDDIDA